MAWHGYDNVAKNTWTIDYFQEKDRKNMKKFNRMKKKRSKQADKLTQYLMDAIAGKNADSVEGEAKQL